MTIREYWEDNAGEGCTELHLWSDQSEWSIVKHDHGLTLLSPGVGQRIEDYGPSPVDDSDEDLEETLAFCDIDAADIAALTGYVAVL